MSPHTPIKTPLPTDVEVGPVSGRILRGSERFSLETPLPGAIAPTGTPSNITRRTFLTPLPVAPGPGQGHRSAAVDTGTGSLRRVQTPLPGTTDISGTTSRVRRSVTGKIVQSIDVPQAPMASPPTAPPIARVAPVARVVASAAPVAPNSEQGVTMMCIHCQTMFSAAVNHSFGTVICTQCGAASRVAVHDCPPLKRPSA